MTHSLWAYILRGRTIVQAEPTQQHIPRPNYDIIVLPSACYFGYDIPALSSCGVQLLVYGNQHLDTYVHTYIHTVM